MSRRLVPSDLCRGNTSRFSYAARLGHGADACYLWRFMIDARYQRRGYGRSALSLLADTLRNQGVKQLSTSYVPGAGGPHEFYLSFGLRIPARSRRTASRLWCCGCEPTADACPDSITIKLRHYPVRRTSTVAARSPRQDRLRGRPEMNSATSTCYRHPRESGGPGQRLVTCPGSPPSRE